MPRTPATTPSIRDIADSAGVSPATVSRVLNNRAGEVGIETRTRVLNTIRRMNYRPRQGPGPTVAVSDTFTLGVVSGMHSRHLLVPGYHKSLMDGIFAAADHYRQNILLYAGHLFHSDPHQSIRTYCDGRSEGMFIIGEIGNTLGTTLRERGIPLVVIGDSGGDVASAFCSVDNVSGSRELTELVVSQGHRRIAICRGPEHLRSSHQRYAGFTEALAANAITLNPRFESPAIPEPGEVTSWARHLLDSLAPSDRPTAIVCFNDVFASAVRSTLTESGLRVPEDISLTGFDDALPASENGWLTTVRQPYTEIGMRSVEALVAQIRGDTAVPQRTILPGELIVRQSVGPPRRAG